MKANTKKIGNIGEDKACLYLISQGHNILERNWRWKHLEVDIISLSDKGLHFIEVKTRVAPAMVLPQENVTINKQKNIVKAAGFYLKKLSNIKDIEVHFDIISIIINKDKFQIDYIFDAYFPIFA